SPPAAPPPGRPPPPRHLLPTPPRRKDHNPLRAALPRLKRPLPLGDRARQPRRRRSQTRATARTQTARRTDRADPTNLRAVRARVARTADGPTAHARDLQLGAQPAPDPLLRTPPPRPAN